MRRRAKGLLLSLLLTVVGIGVAAAADEAYPTKPIHIIVPFAPGGASDFAIRLIQPGLQAALGQQLVIDNRSGAAGSVGMEVAAHAAPDGYTLFLGNVGTIAINPHFFPNLTVKPQRDFIPISLAAETPGIVIASNKFAPNSLKEMIAYAKAHPGKVNYAAAGVSTLNTLSMEQFRHRLGLQMAQVPYKGGAGPAVIDLMAGNVDVMFVTLSSAVQFVKAGKLKAFAVTTVKRVPQLPDVPSMAELGFPDDVSSSWQGLFAVAGTPAPIVARLHAAVLKAMADPDVRQHMIVASMTPTSSPTPESFAKFVAAESDKWKGVVEKLKAGKD
ncbi:MAG: tripartite tricarboxylate transporter substrate binding protein [Rhodopseudomonas sp.]|nr:tripartite tricarboxylate transporter substrate binding protein [Rhodopseudomonas sp.]